MTLRRSFLFTALALLLAPFTLVSSANAQQPSSASTLLTPFLDEQAIAVVRIDVNRIDLPSIAEYLAPLATQAGVPTEQFKANMQSGEKLQAAWKGAGGGEIFIVAGMADAPNSLGFVVARLNENRDLKQIEQLLAMMPFETHLVQGNTLVAGSKVTLERLKTLKPTRHPELNEALGVFASSTIQAVVHLPPDIRRVIRELGPPLPAELGLGKTDELANALRWGVVGVDAPPKFALKVAVQADSAAGAQRLQAAIGAMLQAFTAQKEVKQSWPNFEALAARLKPELKGTRLELDLSGGAGEKALRDALVAPIADARRNAGRSRSMNNLKQIALAFHNYHDTQRKFPAAASRNAQGKALLSWRVLVLPYVDQAPLYEKFKLDEPWDSPNNKALILQIPSVYVAPNQETLAKEGKTVYVVPVGEKSVFAGNDGMTISKITDGTSNTIMAVQAPAARAVIWTQPADWEFDVKNAAAGIFDDGVDGLIAALCDGSVRLIPKTINVKNLLRLLQANDNEPVEPF